MANHGNTGNRYKLRKFAKVEPYTHPSGLPALLVTLECGHSHVVLDPWLPWYETVIAQGKRTRCNDCTTGRDIHETYIEVANEQLAQASTPESEASR